MRYRASAVDVERQPDQPIAHRVLETTAEPKTTTSYEGTQHRLLF